MPQLKNWQIGREMSYPYEGKYPQRQFAFVFNINRCIACQSCTMACKSTWTFSKGQEHMWWANVETKPYGGYPHSWDVKILEKLEQANPDGQTWSGSISDVPDRLYGRFDGLTIFEAAARTLTPDSSRVLGYLPTDEEWNSPNIYEDNPVGPPGARDRLHRTGERLPIHNTWFFYLARICNHCSYPACLAACPRKALYKRPEDGIVLLDQEQCRGYRKCVEACRYKKVMYRGNTRTSEKCIACYPRIEGTDPESDGEPMETRCMAACIGQIRLQGLVSVGPDGTWTEDRYNPIYYLVHVAKVALPLYPQFGTQPNGYYIPPRWVPRPYLRQMFGPGVDRPIERYTNPDRELLAVLQLFRRSNRIIFRYEMREGPKVYEGTLHGRQVTLCTTTRSSRTGNVVRSCFEPPSRSRFTFGPPFMRTRFEPAITIDLTLARAVIYRTLAIGLQSPTEGSLARLKSDAAREALLAATQLLDRTEHVTETLLPAALRLLDGDRLRAADLDTRYVRLFGHTARGLVCPCETEYGPGGGFQQPQQLADIAGYYRAFGLRLRPGDDQRVDHVACECEFMDFLCRKEAFSRQMQQAQRGATPHYADTLEQTRKAEASFLRDHLGRFGIAFGHELVREDEDGFYARLGYLLIRFLDFECRLLDVEAGPASLSVRLDQADDVPMACGTGDSLIQISRREDYGASK